MRKIRFRRTTLFIVGMTAFLAGLGLARTRLSLDVNWVWLSAILLIIAIWRRHFSIVFFVAIFGLTLGWWRGTGYIQKLANYDSLNKRAVIVTGRADTDGIYDGSQLSFDLTNITVHDPEEINLIGKIGVKGFGEAAIYRGDIVQAEGKLYPTRGSRQASISYSQIKVLQRSTSKLEKVRRDFLAGMYSALPEPLASFGLGLLIGQRSTIPDAVNKQLSAVGLTHVVAVSGYNLTIIMNGVYFFLKKRSKYQSTLLSAILIGLFLLFTGFSPSIVRAAIVSLLGLVAAYYGHHFRPLVILLLAAVLTAGWYPIYLWSDIGWYLSFLAFFGVLIVAPLAIKRLYKKGKQPRMLTNVFIETLAAQMMTLPLIMYIFGQISIVSLPANLLVVPLVPLAMAAAFVAALGGMIVPFMAGWFAWPAKILMTYMLDIVNLLARVPHALSQRTINVPQMLMIYAMIVVVAIVLWRKTISKNGIVTGVINRHFKGVK